MSISLSYEAFTAFIVENRPLLNYFVWKFRRPCSLPLMELSNPVLFEERVKFFTKGG